jgi:hypothetical protein
MPDFGIFRGFNEKLFGDKLYAGQLPTQLGLIGSEEVFDFVGLLDDYPNASAAYSLRKLRNAYTGSAIRVRIDTTGNPEYNIGFVDNELDVATLEGYCTGGLNAYVKTWYDQSGNGRDATQATAANQPQIVSSGSVILENSKPGVNFDGIDDFFTLSSNIPSNINYSLFTASFNATNTNRDTYMSGVAGSAQFVNFVPSIFIIKTLTAIVIDGNITKNAFNLNTFFTHNSNNSLYSNGILLNSNTAVANFTNPITQIGRNAANSSEYYINVISEMILYSSNESSNRTGIESNINDFYSIY